MQGTLLTPKRTDRSARALQMRREAGLQPRRGAAGRRATERKDMANSALRCGVNVHALEVKATSDCARGATVSLPNEEPAQA